MLDRFKCKAYRYKGLQQVYFLKLYFNSAKDVL